MKVVTTTTNGDRWESEVPDNPSVSVPSIFGVTPTAEDMAQRFHETYERLAPDFGYATRTDTRKFNPHLPNGKLMIAVMKEILGL